MKKIILLVLILIIICGCSNKKNTKLSKILKDDNYIIVDVRTKEEYNEGHIVEAINIPYDVIEKSSMLDKDKTIIIYCRSGNRSKIAYDKLKSLGYDVLDLGAYENINLEKTN